MKMTAQYTPYRDMVSVENDNDHGSEWDTGNDRGYVQIYEKTVEDRQVVPQRNLIVGGIALALFCSLLGLLVGFFAHSNHAECIPNLSISLNAVRDENPYVQDKLLNIIDAQRIKDNIKKLSVEAHPAGSEVDEKMASELEELWNACGLDKVERKFYNVLLPEPPTPTNPNRLKIVDEYGNTKFDMNSNGDNHKESHQDDEDATKLSYSPYSPSGMVQGGLVYVNRASEEELLFITGKMKIDLSKKIVLARQLDIPPIQQVHNLQKYNVSGLVLYPDPGDYCPPKVHARPYPHSLWLPEDGVIQDAVWWEGLGDPTTIGYPSTEHAYRLPHERDSLLAPFPVQPISFHEASHYLRLLSGEKAPEEWWSGGGNMSFHLGPNFSHPLWQFHMEIHSSYVPKNIQNVIGYIKGKVEPDRYVIVGAQRDSSSYGAVDSAAGTAVLMELVKAFGILLKDGWRPRRTIIFCSWGAEEYGWIGSTEWMEENFKMLREQAVVYINADDLVFENQSITATSSPLLFSAIFNATKIVPNPYELDLSGGDHDFSRSGDDDLEGARSIYDTWVATFPDNRNTSTLLFPEYSQDGTDNDEFVIDVYDMPLEKESEKKKKLHEVYMHAAMLKKRPKVNVNPKKNRNVRYMKQIGVPTVDIAYVNDYQLTKVAYPLYHSQYDTFEAIEKFVDPTFKVHAAVAKVLGELIRDVSDSLFIPFNLIDYAQHLRDLSIAVQTRLTPLLKREALDVDISALDSAVQGFTAAAVKFHENQEKLDLSDPMTIRRINDQLLILERIFVDPINIRRQVPTQKSAIESEISDSSLHDLLFTPATSNSWGIFPLEGDGGDDPNNKQQQSQSKHSQVEKLYERVYYHLVFACQSATKVLEGLV